MSWLSNNSEYDAGGNAAEVEGRGDWLAEHPEPDYSGYEPGDYCDCGAPLFGVHQTRSGRCRRCGE